MSNSDSRILMAVASVLALAFVALVVAQGLIGPRTAQETSPTLAAAEALPGDTPWMAW